MRASALEDTMIDPVVITGSGIICSFGDRLPEIWDSVLSGKRGVRPIEGFETAGFDCRFAGQVRGLDPRDMGISPRDSRIMDIHSYMLMKCSRDAFLQAGIETSSIPGEEIGFFAGMGMVDYDIEDLLPAVLKSRNAEGGLDYEAFFEHGYKEIYPLWPLSMLNNISFCQVAISLKITGENAVFSPHADSGLQAVAEAMKTVEDGKSRVALAGGVSEKVSPISLARGHLSGTLSSSGGENGLFCRPFAADRNGTVPGEGCGVVTIELLSSAKERGAPVLASIAGYGASCGTDGNFACPDKHAYSQAMRSALASAGKTPSDIDVLVAHGDGTPPGDGNEIEAINEVFRDREEELHIYCSKGSLGHLLAGAPLVDIILGLSMLRTGLVPPTLTSRPADKALHLGLVTEEALRVGPKRIMINCGSGEGQAASLIIEAAAS